MKAICLHSGGLDSSLAVLLVKEQGITPVAAQITSPFWGTEGESAAEVTARAIGVDYVAVPVGEDYLDMLRSPRHGYGKNANPCIDCHIYMLRLAKDLMHKRGGSFVATGEVAGQRPMSQRIDMLRRIEKESGLEGLLLRPLSAKLLPPTIPEKEGWVDRERLLGISGRSRAEQMALARSRDLKGYSTPAGGCLLTDPAYSAKVMDLINHDSLNMTTARRLRTGRHFRLPGGSKLIVGRNERENEALMDSLEPGDLAIVTASCPGPTGLVTGPGAPGELALAASVVARYADDKASPAVRMSIIREGTSSSMDAVRLEPDKVAEMLL
jgi:tRNA-specific 2-thiouridylase